MIPKHWKIFHRYLDHSQAQLEVGRLNIEGVPAMIDPDMLIPGLNREYRVLIPIIFEEQALQIVQASEFTEEELNSLAIATQPQKE